MESTAGTTKTSSAPAVWPWPSPASAPELCAPAPAPTRASSLPSRSSAPGGPSAVAPAAVSRGHGAGRACARAFASALSRCFSTFCHPAGTKPAKGRSKSRRVSDTWTTSSRVSPLGHVSFAAAGTSASTTRYKKAPHTPCSTTGETRVLATRTAHAAPPPTNRTARPSVGWVAHRLSRAAPTPGGPHPSRRRACSWPRRRASCAVRGVARRSTRVPHAAWRALPVCPCPSEGGAQRTDDSLGTIASGHRPLAQGGRTRATSLVSPVGPVSPAS